MGFYDSYKTVFINAKASLEKVTDLNNVVSGERYRIAKLPMAVIDPGVTPIKKGSVGGKLQLALRFQVYVIVTANEPEDWLEEIVKPMGAVVDQILSDKTLSGAVLDVFPRGFVPRTLPLKGKVYYGGVIEFEATLFHS